MTHSVEVIRIPALSDNYIWLMHDEASGESVVIDPAVADPVLDAAKARKWTITQIWNTHWHGDHIGGNEAIKAATGCHVTGRGGTRIRSTRSTGSWGRATRCASDRTRRG